MEHDYDREGEQIPSLKLHGYACAATVRATTLKQRALGQRDALIVFDAFTWERLDDDERRAVIDHELYHLQVVSEERGVPFVLWDPVAKCIATVPKHDDLGRPKLKLRLHDWHLGGFRAIAERHGDAALEVRAFRSTADEHGQFLLDLGESRGEKAA
jgi:hypothetical protein